MARITILAEKISMAKDIAGALINQPEWNKRGYFYGKCSVEPYKNAELFVTFAMGHLYTLANAVEYDEKYKTWDMDVFPCLPKKYIVVPKKDKNCNKQIQTIKNLFRQSSLIVNACDAEREGELIFTYIYERAGVENIPYKRLWLQAFTAPSIRKAFANMKTKEEQKNAVVAAKLRAAADWAVGANCTVFATLKFGNQNSSGPISMGRVQTPALTFLAKRELEIRNFKKEPYWIISSLFTTAGGESFRANYEDGKFFNKQECEDVVASLQGKQCIVQKIVNEKLRKNVPDLYNTLNLQTVAAKKFGFSAQHTLNLLQTLYEKKLTTYPRVDAVWLPEDMKDNMKQVLTYLSGIPEYKDFFFDENEWVPFSATHFNDKQLQKHGEAHHAIVPTGKDFRKETGLTNDELKIYDLVCKSVIRLIYPAAIFQRCKIEIDCDGKTFIANGTRCLEANWCKVDAMPKTNILPALAKGEVLDGKFETAEKETVPPPRYSDESFPKLLSKAENSIEDKELAKILKGKGIGRPSTTAGIIETLIKRGFAIRKKNKFYCTDLGIYLYEHLPMEDLKKADLTAEWEMELEEIANGNENAGKFWKKVEDNVIKWCGQIKALNVSDIDSVYQTELDAKCPVCGGKVLITRYGYQCEHNTQDNDECYFFVPNVFCKKKITASQVERLIKNGKTTKMKGFVSKKNNKFDAVLTWDQSNPVKYSRLSFVFDN